MFSKKKSDNELITIDQHQPERRKNVRIRPMLTLYIHHNDLTFEVIDISSAGLAFRSDKLKGKNKLDISFELPPWPTGDKEKITINCSIKIIHTCNGIFHCQFFLLDPDTKAQIDRYILNEQKRQIRSKNL